MTGFDAKAELHDYLQGARETLLWKLELHHVLVHMTAETQRHAGHADILRELIDGAVGLLKNHGNMSSDDPAWWRDYHEQVEQAARSAATRD